MGAAEARRLRVVVVDDSEVVRAKMRSLLEAENGFELVGEAEDGESGLSMAREQQPDLVVMDLRMPGMSGIEATWQLGTVAPQSKVLVLTVSLDQEDVTDAIMAGARGYVVKGAADEEIAAAMKGVAEGHRMISPQIASNLSERVTKQAPAPEPPRPLEGDALLPLAAIALAAGIALCAIGQGDQILDGTASASTWIGVVLNFVVAFVAVALAALFARRD